MWMQTLGASGSKEELGSDMVIVDLDIGCGVEAGEVVMGDVGLKTPKMLLSGIGGRSRKCGWYVGLGMLMLA